MAVPLWRNKAEGQERGRERQPSWVTIGCKAGDVPTEKEHVVSVPWEITQRNEYFKRERYRSRETEIENVGFVRERTWMNIIHMFINTLFLNATVLYFSIHLDSLALDWLILPHPTPSDVATWSNDLHPTYFPKYCALVSIPMTLPWESSRRVTGLATPPPPPVCFFKNKNEHWTKVKKKGEQNITIIAKIKFSKCLLRVPLLSGTNFWLSAKFLPSPS